MEMVGCVLKFRRFCKFLLCAGMGCGLFRIRILTFLEKMHWKVQHGIND